jgi:glucose/arabinose dehydrogenase
MLRVVRMVVIAVLGVLVVAGCGDDAARVASEPPPSTAARTALDEVYFRTEEIGRYDRPVWAGSPPGDDRIFVVEQHRATIRIIGQEEPFLTLPEPVATGGEQGLLGLAFHPGFADNGRYVVNFTNADGDTRVVEFREGSAEPVRTWLEVDQPYDNHNGGHVVFGPDGRLYVGMGDGGAGGDPENRAQDDATLLGKLLAIDVDGGDAAPQVVAKGLRNPWRFSFSDDGSTLWIGDVGQDAWEEIDRVPFPLPDGANFGWRLLEGTHAFADGGAAPAGYSAPVFEYSHDEGCSVTGGVTSGRMYLFGDYCSSKYWIIVGDTPQIANLDVPAPTHFGEDATDQILVASGEGGIFRVTPI